MHRQRWRMTLDVNREKMKFWNKNFNLPIVCGLILFVLHSLPVLGLWDTSRRNIELGVLWSGLQTMDFPISILMDRFFALYEGLTEVTYPDQYLVFHFFLGGAQFFFFGLLVGVGYKFINISNKYKIHFIITFMLIIFVFSLYGFVAFCFYIIFRKYYIERKPK